MRWHWAWLGAGAVAILALLAACGGGASEKESEATAPPGADVTASGVPVGLVPSCGDIESISSFRYAIRLKLDIPGLPTPPGDADRGPPQATEEPFGALAAVLLGLFSDLQIDGAYVAPDRSRAILHISGQEVEVRSIGDRSWVRFGDVWQEETASTEVAFLSPQAICHELVPDLGGSLADVPWSPETINGIVARYYHLDKANLPQLTGLLGVGEGDGLPEEFRVDVWLAEEGGWPVRLQMEARGRDETGMPVGLELFLELRDIGNPDIKIEPPEVIGGQA